MNSCSLKANRSEIGWVADAKAETWLAASLTPFRIYTCFAALWLVLWHARLPTNRAVSFRAFEFDYTWWWATWDFAYAAHLVLVGYFIAAAVLALGGTCQFLSGSRRPGYRSLVFASLALVLGLLLSPYQDVLQWRIF